MSDSASLAALRDSIIEITAKATRRRLTPSATLGRSEFSSLGVDSVNVFEIILNLEKQHSVTLNDTFLFNYKTPDEAAYALHKLIADNRL